MKFIVEEEKIKLGKGIKKKLVIVKTDMYFPGAD